MESYKNGWKVYFKELYGTIDGNYRESYKDEFLKEYLDGLLKIFEKKNRQRL